MAKTEAETEIEKMKILEERIKAPSIWCRLPCGIRLQDLQDTRYEHAAQLLDKHYLNQEVTYRSVNIKNDEEATEEFLNNARIWMKDKMSIAAVNEETDELIGVIIMRIQEKCSFSRTFSRVKLTYNLIYSSIMSFYNEIEKSVNLYEKLQVRKYLKVYALALEESYRHKGLGKEFLNSAMALAASAHVPAISGIFTSKRSQELATELGFQKFSEILYYKYLNNDQVLFTGIDENSSAALMAYRIPDVEEVADLEIQQLARFNNEPAEGEETSKNN